MREVSWWEGWRENWEGLPAPCEDLVKSALGIGACGMGVLLAGGCRAKLETGRVQNFSSPGSLQDLTTTEPLVFGIWSSEG